MKPADIVIVGAGVAGLACARALAGAGHDVAIYEARDRIGGRIFTVRDPKVPLAIELGAEFIHGDAPETERICREAGLHAYEVCGEHQELLRGHARAHDFGGGIDRVLRRIDPRRPDESFAAFLKRRPGGRSLARDRRIAEAFVQGYHAADLTQISTRSIAPDPGEPASASTSRMARILEGQDRIPHWLAEGGAAAPGDIRIQLGTAVTGVTWERGHAMLDVRSTSGTRRQMKARAVVFTVSIGVLKAEPGDAGGIAFHPDPPRLRDALDGQAMGTVARLNVLFRELPWLGLGRRAGGADRTGHASREDAPERFEALERAAFFTPRARPSTSGGRPAPCAGPSSSRGAAARRPRG